MKARIKSTGEIVEVEQMWHGVFRDYFGNMYMWDAIDLQSESEQPILETHINWEARRYELAKAAMQGFIANTDLFDRFEETGDSMICLCSDSIAYADEMIRLLKGETRR